MIAFAALAAATAACLDLPADADPAADGAPDTPDAPVARQLFVNSDFEQGPDGWQVSGTAGIGESSDFGVTVSAFSGDRFAQVGHRNGLSNGISQRVMVPAWATALRLTGQRCFVTENSSTSDDQLTVSLRSPEGDTLEVLYAVSNGDVAGVCDWSAFEFTAAGSHAGEEIDVSLWAVLDGTDVTTFWFDDVTLVADPD
jgi:hypothetical protein